MNPTKDISGSNHETVSDNKASEIPANNSFSHDVESAGSNEKTITSSISKDTGFSSDSVASSPSLEGVKDVLSKPCTSSYDNIQDAETVHGDSVACGDGDGQITSDTGQLTGNVDTLSDHDEKCENDFMDILGNGLLKKTVRCFLLFIA